MNDQTSTIRITARLPADVHKALAKAAAADARSLNGELVTALREWLEQKGYLEKRRTGERSNA